MKKPITPQQALNNFRLFTEIHPTRNSHEQYVESVTELAETVLELGIIGDDQHPDPVKDALAASLDECIAFIKGTSIHPFDEDDEDDTITGSVDYGPEFTVNIAAANKALLQYRPLVPNECN